MKKNSIIKGLLASCALLLAACSEETFSPNFSAERNVTTSISYANLSPKEIVVTRATQEEERQLDNLYIYIFDENGKLKGFKAIEGNDKLTQNTSNSLQGEVSGIKTKSGASYIFAVANVGSDGLYPLETTSDGTVTDGKLPIGFDEEKAQDGDYNFTMSQLKSILFKRSSDNSIDMTSAGQGWFLMGGSLNGGKVVNIDESGNLTGDVSNIIYLTRIVSKIKFTVSAGSGCTFKLSSYDIINVAKQGYLIGKVDGNDTKYSGSNFTSFTNRQVSTQNISNGKYSFEFYLPENLQDAKKEISNTNGWSQLREDDGKSTPKVFTYAPDNGTYIVLKGKYTGKRNSNNVTADVTYYVHLGDCSTNANDYNVERNCIYTYNITVAGVDNIIVEAEKTSNNQPGAEGVVLEFGSAGKTKTLDSHYEHMVMRFYKNEIAALKEQGILYQVQALTSNGETAKTDVIAVKDDVVSGTSKNDVNTDWIEFAIGGTYNDTYNGRGTAVAYPGTTSNKLYKIEDFLKLLYKNSIGTSSDFTWTDASGSNPYIDVTCFVDENYYVSNKFSWDKYAGKDIPNRSFYVATDVKKSEDGRSLYATVKYGLDQYPIQTFYDRSQASSSSFTAYGVETVDETGVSPKDRDYKTATKSETWYGRNSLKTDLGKKTWSDINKESNISPTLECMKRNRDLNGDGTIDDDEVRWYAPTIKQYTGLWIGEEALSTASRLYTKETSMLGSYNNNDGGNGNRMIYWSSSTDYDEFWSEEGMAVGSYADGWKGSNKSNLIAKYVKCARNLKSNDKAVGTIAPTEYWTTSNSNKTLELTYVDQSALNTVVSNSELTAHTERDDENKAAKKFTVAGNFYPGSWQTSQGGRGQQGGHTYSSWQTTMGNVVEGTQTCRGYKDTYSDNKSWRVPNQRELCVIGTLLNKDLITNGLCRTKYSNANFRYSWTFASGNLMMKTPSSNTDGKSFSGYIRCIHVEQ